MSHVRFAVVGAAHFHIFDMVAALQAAGGELVGFYEEDSAAAARFAALYPQVPAAGEINRLLEDPRIQLIVSAAVPDRRAPLGISVLQHGKDFFSDKPGFTTLEQLAAARRVQAETARLFHVYYADRLASPATVRATELAQAGAVGRVVQTIGLGPHRMNPDSRPAWFFRPRHYGGILADIGVHQVDQFLWFTESRSAEIVAAQIANFSYPQYPEFEDFGDVTLRGETPRGDTATGYFRVDWYTPDGLSTWGDTRLLVLGTEGYMEVRKNVDLAGRPGGEHLLLVDHQGVQYVDCNGLRPPYPAQLLADVLERSETAMPQDYCFLVSELALQAQEAAVRLGNLKRAEAE